MQQYEYASIFGRYFRRSVGPWEPMKTLKGSFTPMNPKRKSLKILREIAAFFKEQPGILEIQSADLIKQLGCSPWQFNRAVVDPEAPLYIDRPRWGWVAPAKHPEA